VFILPQLTKNLPSESIDEGLSIPSTVVLADPEFGQPGSIDLLLGAEVYSRLIRPGPIDLGDDKPTLQETALGWIVFGAVRRRVSAAMARNIMTITREDPLPALEKFWKLDTFNTEVPAMTVQERLCEEHFLSIVQFCPDQRLMVRLPFAENPRELGKTLALAQRRFSSIERRLERDPAMLEGYVSFMDEYKLLNPMTEVQLSSVPRNHYFIPHHCALKPDGSTTKLRVVFEASGPSSTGKSFNNIQRVGPTVQSDLLSILLRFRTHRFVFTADVEKMYRQIWVHPQDIS